MDEKIPFCRQGDSSCRIRTFEAGPCVPVEMEVRGDAGNLEPLDSVRFPWLFWGDRKVARNEQLLRRRKIAYIINCTPPCGEGGVPNFHERLSRGSRPAFRYLRIPIYDTHTETLQPYFEEVWEFMETCRTREDGNVLVHCNHGVSRSVAFICSYLIKYAGMSSDEALAFVRQRNPLAKPNESFRDQLKKLHEHVMKESRYGHSEPRQSSQGQWVPPCSSGRKRVASCSLPNPRPQPKVVRQMGPARPPQVACSPPASDEAVISQEANELIVSPSSCASNVASLPAAIETEAEWTLAAEESSSCKDSSPQAEPLVAAASPAGEDADASEETNKTTDGLPPPTPSAPSPSERNEATERIPACDECAKPLGCKDTFNQQRVGFEGSPPSTESTGLLGATCLQVARGDCEPACAAGEPAVAPDRQSRIAATYSAVHPHDFIAKEDGLGTEGSILGKDTDRNSMPGLAREAVTWNPRRLVDPSDSRKTVQAAILRVL